MRGLIAVIAVLVTLGLAAFGVMAARQAPFSTAPAASGAPAASHAAAPAEPAGPPNGSPARTAAVRLADASGSTVGTPAPSPTETPTVAPARSAQDPNHPAVAATTTTTAPAGERPSSIASCDKPGGMGLSRIVEIDTTGGPGLGFEHFKQYDFLRDKEIVLTFDDGPWPENTTAVLKALADNCLKATFFEIGEHATWHPELAKQVAAAGHTIGSHTWSHKDLARNPYAKDLDLAKQEVEMGVSAVHLALGAPFASFFRFPDLQHPPAVLSYLAERNIATISTDIDSFDFKMRKPEQVIQSVMSKLQKRGKGIILMHDFQRNTAEALPELLRQLKAGGYKAVHLVSRAPVTTLPQYDEMVMKQDKLSVTNTRPTSSVVRTISE